MPNFFPLKVAPWDSQTSSTRITFAPFTVLLGFIVVGIGIMLKPKSQDKTNSIIAKH